MAEKMMARVKLEANMRFGAEAGSGYHVVLDAPEDGGGHNAGFRPMELLLVGLAGCTGMDVISILRKNRQQVTAYEVHVEGIRAEGHPKVFTEIGIEYIITGHHVQPDAVIRAIRLSAERYCGAGAMLGKVARITHTFRIVDAAQTQALTAARSQAVSVTTV
jgi:putative redox protein